MSDNVLLKFLLDTIIPPFLILIGTLSNILVISVYSQVKFRKLATKNVWRLLSLVDIFCLLQIIKYFLSNTFNYSLYMISPFMCKLIAFLTHFGTVSSWLVVYISSERLTSLVFPKLNKLIQRNQITIFFIILIFYICFYSQRFIYNGFVYQTLNNSTTTKCSTLKQFIEINKTFKWIDTFISTIIPFILMFISSIFLIYTVFSSRKRLASSKSIPNKRKLAKDIRFSVTLIALNFVFVSFKLPAIIYLSAGGSRTLVWFSLLDDLYYSCYAVNFFIYLAANSIFRQQFLIMIGFGKSKRKEKTYTVS